MKKFVFGVILLMIYGMALAIKPKKEYAFKPSALGVSYVEKMIKTADGVQVNTWYMKASDSIRGTVIISGGDVGNMSEWFGFAGLFLGENFDVYMFDYRGFGGSDSFAIDANQLYYGEFVDDLRAVVEYARGGRARDIILFGASMGSIVAMEYLKSGSDSIVRKVIFDSYVPNSVAVAGRVKAKSGRSIIVPKGVDYAGKIDKEALVLVGSSDYLCEADDLERLKGSVKKCEIVVFDCGHLQAFSRFTELYCDAVSKFLK